MLKSRLIPSYLQFGYDVTASFVVDIKVANVREQILRSLHVVVNDVKMQCDVTFRLGVIRSDNFALFVVQY